MNKKSNEEFEQLIDYVDLHLTDDISFKKLSQILGVNEYTMHRIFLFVTGLTLGDYIRKRKLSEATINLINGEKIIDVAIKYGYNSSQSFSRAFKSVMGINPNEVGKKANNIKFFPKYELNIDDTPGKISYQIKKNLTFELYAVQMKTTVEQCHNEAPAFWNKNEKYLTDNITYGLLQYDKTCAKEEAIYYIAQKSKFKGAQKINLEQGSYLVFDYNYTNSTELYKFIKKIYKNIIINHKYELTSLPDIEEYHNDGSFKLYIPVNL